MKKFKFFQDLKVKVWQRYTFYVEAETKEEALKEVSKFNTEEGFACIEGWDTETLFETQETMKTCENEGQATIQLWDADKNEMIGSNAPKTEDFIELYNYSLDIDKLLRKACIDYITKVLKGRDGEMIVLDPNSMDEEMREHFYAFTVPYNGGNDPDYDSNCFSKVKAAYLKNNEIYLDIEETDEYAIENINASDIENVAEHIKEIIDYENEEE